MGRALGYHDSDDLDRPELNQCPDCECYFASETCPLCGKLCPEEFRAGHRAKAKPKRRRRSSSGRVQFIPWYHTWPAILIMMCIMPFAGVILFITSPYSKKSKILTVCAVVGGIILTGVLGSLASGFMGRLLWDPPINDDISREAYIERCQPMTAEEFYRNSARTGMYVTMDLTVVDVDVQQDLRVYTCRGAEGETLSVRIMDYRPDGSDVFMRGDRLRVYGECGGLTRLADGTAVPVLFMAYCDRTG